MSASLPRAAPVVATAASASSTAVPTAHAVAKRPALESLSSMPFGVDDPAMMSRLAALRQKVEMQAKQETPGSSSSGVQLEQLISSNRDQATEIASLTQAAAQREALIGSLQAQLAQAKLQSQQVHQQAGVEQEQLMTQNQQLVQQTQQQFQQQQRQLAQQLQQGLAAAAQSQAAQQLLIRQLASILSQTQRWLQCLAGRCAAQSVELPMEATNALKLLQSVSSVAAAFGAEADGSMPPMDGSALAPNGGLPRPAPFPTASAPAVPSLPAMAAAPSDVKLEEGAAAEGGAEAAGGEAAEAAAQSSALELLAEASQSPLMGRKGAAAAAPAGTAAAAAVGAAAAAAAAAGTAAAAAAGTAACSAPASSRPPVGAADAGSSAIPAPESYVAGLAANLGAEVGAGCSPGTAACAFSPGANLTFSPSGFCSLLNSPDLQQLMNPCTRPTPPAGSVPVGSGPPAAGGASAAASAAASQFSQFKRRQNGMPSNMAI